MRVRSSLKDKAALAFMWQLLNVGYKSVAQLIYIVVMARLVSKNDFGVFAILSIVILFAQSLAEGGIGASIVQRQVVNKSYSNTAFTLSLLFGISFMLIISIILPFISEIYELRLTATVKFLLLLNILVASLGIASRAWLIRRFQFKRLFLCNFGATSLGYLIIGVSLGYLDFGFLALLIAYVSQTVFVNVAYFFAANKSYRIEINVKEYKQILDYGMGLIAARTLTLLSTSLDKIILGVFLTSSNLGVYERSQTLIRLPHTILGSTLDSVLFSTYSKLQNNLSKVSESFYAILTLSLAFTCLVTYVVCSYGDIIVLIFLGSEWTEAIPVVQILIFATTFLLWSRISDTIYRALDELWLSARISVMNVLALCFMLYWSGPYKSLTLSAFIILCVSAVYGVVKLIVALRLLDGEFKMLMGYFKNVLFLFIVLFVKKWFVHLILLSPSATITNILTDIVFLIIGFIYFPIFNISTQKIINNITFRTTGRTLYKL